MGEYEPNDSRNVTGTAATPDGRWTGQAANDPTMTDQQRQAQQGGQQGSAPQQQGGMPQQQGGAPQQQQGGDAIGQSGDGVSGASNQGNDHTSAIGQNQSAGAAGSGQASYGDSGQGMSQPQQFQDRTGQQGGSGGSGRFADQLAKHQEVVDADGQHVGTVDHVDGDRIKLTRKDSPDGEHHYISISEVAGIEGGRVRLSGSGSAGSGSAGSGGAQ